MPQINIDDIIRDMQQRQNKANKANRERYDEGKGLIEEAMKAMSSRYDTAASLYNDLGQSMVAQISQGAARQAAMGRQQLISAGLGNTTITGSMMRGVESDRQMASQRAQEGLAQQQAGLAERRAGSEMAGTLGLSDWIRSREDRAPDPGLYSSLVQQAAQQSEPAGKKPMDRIFMPRTSGAGKWDFLKSDGGGQQPTPAPAKAPGLTDYYGTGGGTAPGAPTAPGPSTGGAGSLPPSDEHLFSAGAGASGIMKGGEMIASMTPSGESAKEKAIKKWMGMQGTEKSRSLLPAMFSFQKDQRYTDYRAGQKTAGGKTK